MREIKFRVWDIGSKKMMNVERIDWGLGDKYGLRVFARKGFECYWIFQPKYGNDSEGFELMQYIDLKDKNGREIYEGDIIEGLHDFGPGGFFKRIGVVEWKGDGYMMHYWEQPEVIGNIYENPELLK